MSRALRDILCCLLRCLDEDERYRPSAQDLLKHPFVAPDVLTSLPPLDHVSESQTEAKLGEDCVQFWSGMCISDVFV